MTRVIRAAAVGLATALALGGCSQYPWDDDPDRILPPSGAGFDYQLGGGYALPAGVEVVARDRTDMPAEGAYNICYLNGFQTQPGSERFWLIQREHLVLHDDDGEPVVDPAWPDEYLLDTSTVENRIEIAEILGGWISQCETDGFDAVEIDNLDTSSRSDGALSLEDNIDQARRIARIAHGLGLAIAQKNGAEHSARLRDEAGFDFAVTEDCAQFRECDDYTDAYGDLVFDIEYDPEFFTAACSSVGSAVLRDLALAPAGAPGYVFETC